VAKRSKNVRTVRVAELFAGVGGFRLGLERASGPEVSYKVVFSNQWEPGKRIQHASNIYVARFGKEHHTNGDIASVPTSGIPDHDLLVGGFPCQDYSVASTLRNSKGLVGKKGVLWWQIHRILKEKDRPPQYLLLENVDRLLSSPVAQRGRDLAVMLRSLDLLGYAVEWRVVNAAEHGMPQRRRRVFIVGYRKGTPEHKAIKRATPTDWCTIDGPMALALPCKADGGFVQFSIEQDLDVLSNEFGQRQGTSPFGNTGIMIEGQVFTGRTKPAYDGEPVTLGSILQPEDEVPEEFYIKRSELKQWRYLKGAKKEARVSQGSGHTYSYSEGAMVFPDPLDRPSRTIITGEGGRAASRFKHVVCVDGKRYRRLTPVELERLNMFPDGHTAGVSDTWRAFFMGNALVVGVVERIGRELLRWSPGS